MKTLRLILGDQLNPLHPWFGDLRSDVVYCLIEMRQETDYVVHHAQKVLAVFAAMRAFARLLGTGGHRVDYLEIDAPENRQSLVGNLSLMVERHGANSVEYQLPDEWRLDEELRHCAKRIGVPVRSVDSHHFLSARDDAQEIFGARRQWLMETFYRQMRIRHGVLMDDGARPIGGRWNFDAENRKRWPGTPPEPPEFRPMHDHGALWDRIVASGVQTWGEPSARRFPWPVDRAEALSQLERFVTDALPNFGDFQDAMSVRAWRLHHSLLSFAMNVKMLSPREVITRVEGAFRDGRVPIAAAEGFIRQILGWREYVRGVYWSRMPDYADMNHLNHVRPLPSWYWTGETRMRCLSTTIRTVHAHAYAHHIQRLMITGSFALLAGINPAAVHRWYLGVFIDAFEWVELPNTLGMSQYADGGMLATKPYVSSAAYIDRMSDYCKGCRYRKDLRTGADACPFNALYWDFLDRNASRLEGNPRLAMPYRQLKKMSPDDLAAIRGRAAGLLENLESL